MEKQIKIGICGTGHVGAHCAYTLMMQGVADTIVLVDTDADKLLSEQQDLSDAACYMPHRTHIEYGKYADLKDCDILVMSVGTIFEGERNRLEELHESKRMIDECLPPILESGFNGIIINITNPCDVITHYIYEKSGFDANRVLGTGTLLDTMRLKAVLSRETNMDHKSIQAFVLGEHGESQMVPWSCVTINGIALREMERRHSERFALDYDEILEESKTAGWRVIQGKGATEYAIAASLSYLVKCIIHDEKQLLPVSANVEGQYGLDNIHISVPCIVGKDGIEEIIIMPLVEQELGALYESANVIQENFEKL